MSYTPGPWTIGRHSHKSAHDDGEYPSVATVYSTDNKRVVGRGKQSLSIRIETWSNTEKEADEAGEANARLIAAAPELLGAAKALLYAIENLSSHDVADINEVEKLAKKAIAKAEGREA